MLAAWAAARSSAPNASGRRRWCQVIVVLAGAANSTSSSGAVDLDVHVGRRRLRQRLEQRADGRDGGLVGGEPPVVRDRLQGEPPARAGHRELVARLDPLRPLRRGTGPVQQELDLQGVRGRVVAARRVGADHRRRPVRRDDRAVGPRRGQVRRVLALGGQEHLQVRGRRGVGEPVELVAGDQDRDQPGRDRRHGHDLGPARRLPPPGATWSCCWCGSGHELPFVAGPPMITKDLCTYAIGILRQDKSLRDHDAAGGACCGGYPFNCWWRCVSCR